MDLATDMICQRQCHLCTNGDALLCRRWVNQFEAWPDYVLELERDNSRLQERADGCWKLAWDCMSYICAMRDEKLISKAAFSKLKERAEKLGIGEKE